MACIAAGELAHEQADIQREVAAAQPAVARDELAVQAVAAHIEALHPDLNNDFLAVPGENGCFGSTFAGFELLAANARRFGGDLLDNPVPDHAD
ncbi:MAG: hypothetical protein AAF478_13455 [Pseudomonadota bacterium]